MGLFDFFESRVVMRELDALHRSQKLVRIEIEGRGVRFKTLITLRKDVVAIARPLGFKWQLPAGTVLRLRVPSSRRDLRLRVGNPDFRLPNGRSFFVCPMPKEFAEKSPRTTERYSTMRFTNLELLVGDMGNSFRVLDLSLSGCRIDMGKQQLEAIWNLGEVAGAAEIRVGQNIRIPIAGIIPRIIKDGTMGLEFQIERGAKTVEYLTKLVSWLDKQEDKMTRVVASAG